MAINKNFVVKNGLEVKTDLLVADTTTNNVGIGTTIAGYKLHVNGGIGATDLYISGVSTFAGIGTFSNDFYVGGNLSVTKDITANRNLKVSGISTFVGFSTFQDSIFVAGVSTFGGFSTFRNDVFVAGVSTFAGFSTFRNNVLVAGVSTFVSDSTFQNNVYVTGVSTFVGVSTFQGDLYVGGDLYIADDLRFDEFTARNINVTGVGTIATLDTDVATIDYLSGTNLNYTGIGTVSTLASTLANIGSGYINVGVVTHLTSTNLSASGISTLGVTSATNLTAQQLNVSGVSTFNNTVNFGPGGYISTSTNNLNIEANTDVVIHGYYGGTKITSQPGANLVFVDAVGGDVSLYYQTSAGPSGSEKRLQTLGAGVTVTGTTFTNQLSVSGITTSNSYNVGGTQVISSGRELQNIASLDATTTATIEAAIANAPNTFTDITVTGISTLGVTSATNLTAQQLNVSGITTLGVTNVSQLNSAGVVTATGGFNLGISSAGTTITSGPVTTLNFIGTGNTFAVNGTTVDISIAGGGGAGAGGTWSTYTAGIATSKSVGVNTSTLDDNDLVGVGNSFQGLYVGNGMIIVDNQLNGNHYIGTNFNGLMVGPVTINGTLTVDGNYVVV